MTSIAAIILAAGESKRWGADNKLLAQVDGKPMVLHAVRAVLDSKARPVVVVIGHEHSEVERLLTGLPVSFVNASDYATGLSASLKAGISAVPPSCDGALVCLGDMPWVRASTLDKLIEAFEPDARAAVVPVHGGEWGNPVLLGRALFPDIGHLSGDRGARALLKSTADRVKEIPVDDPAVLRDVDRPDSLVYPLKDGIQRPDS
jgi:molybdenum cofactor cytidylyltransferase